MTDNPYSSDFFPPRPAGYDKKIALVLQGGGALGSYQAGVYEALSATDYIPHWVAGISIGAINAAIIAGNPEDQRVIRLNDFWQSVTAPTALWPSHLPSPVGSAQRDVSALATLLFGQPGLFAPRTPLHWLDPAAKTSFYDTSPLRSTLERLVDFDRINSRREMRLSVGAVNIQTGRLIYFDSADIELRPEHIMASGALPPGFPPVEIDGEFYWDGGLVSNTPLQYVMEHDPQDSLMCFQVDVFQAFGELPTTMDEVNERISDIRYSSRTRVNTDAFQKIHEMRHAIMELEQILPDAIKNTPQAQRLRRFDHVTEMDVVQLIYRPFEHLGAAKDYEFSRPSMLARWEQGVTDARATLCAAPWLAPRDAAIGVRVFDVIHDQLIASMQGALPA
jgi:NTE family protein